MSFKDQVVIITGGSSGIGAATAKQFAKESAKVVIVGRNKSKLSSVAEECEKYGEPPLVIIADLTNDDEAKTIIEKTIAQFGKLDVLINNAGMSSVSNTMQDSNLMEQYDKIMTTNLRSCVHMTHLAVPELIKTKGNIVNVSSVLGMSPGITQLVYATSKAGINHFSRCVALQLAKDGVRVNTVNPGPVRTDFMLNMGLHKQLSKVILDTMGQNAPIKGVSESEEIADLIVYLASDRAKSITGVLYPIDRGILLVGCSGLARR